MADHLSEEEQLESIKQWFKDNFLTFILPLIVICFGYIGWGMYSSGKVEHAQNGSEAFQSAFDMLEKAPDQKLTDEEAATFIAKTDDIAKSHEGSLYADLSRLLQAKLAFQQGRLDDVESSLQSVASKGANDAVKALAKARLARFYLDQKKYDEALSQVSATTVEGFTSVYAEIRGDIAFAQGNKPGANVEYKAAIAAMAPEDYERRAVVELKEKSTAIAAVESSQDPGNNDTADVSEGA